MPVGAQEAYQEKRTLGYLKGITNTVVVTGILFLLIFLAGLGLLNYLGRQDDQQLAGLANISQSETKASQMQKTVSEINTKLEIEANLEDQLTYWSPILNQISAIIPQGIVLTGFNYAKEGQPVSMTGTAQTREALVNFRNALVEQDLVESIQIPTTNLTENRNINFTIALVLIKDALKPKNSQE